MASSLEGLEIVQTWNAGKVEEITLKHWIEISPKHLIANTFAGGSGDIIGKLQRA